MTAKKGTTRRNVLKSMALGTAACVLTDMTDSCMALAGPGGGKSKLQRTSPESVGIAPEAILAFVQMVEQKVGGLHSFMLLRHGKVAAEGWWAPYAPQYPHMLYSLSKSFTSTAIGLAVTEGRLTVDDPVTAFFPDELPAKVEGNLGAMRVRHLLSMSTGHDKDATGPATSAPDGNWVKAFLALPVEHEPGSKFVYNSAATYMLSAIVQKLTKMTVLDYLTPRLFAPLGIEKATWETCPKGINTGGWGLSIKTEDIAKFGQLLLQKGDWDGKTLVPEKWVAEATAKHISNGDPANPSDWSQGYGYQFWRCQHGGFRGDGAFGQYCVVLPEQDAVLAITSGVGDMQAVLNALWEHLLPALKPGAPSGAGSSSLKQKLASLNVPVPEGKATSPTAERISGKTYTLDANEEKIQAVTLTFQGKKATATIRDAKGEQKMTGGSDEWVRGTQSVEARPPLDSRAVSKIATRGVWTDENTFVMRQCFYETPYIETITCRFEGDKITVERKRNVGFGPTTRPVLTGKMV